MKGFARTLREARLAAGLSQAEVAKRVGVTQPVVSNWERGRATPTDAQKGLIQEFLGTAGEETGGSAGTRGETSPLGTWLSRVRNKKGWTPVELARKAGLNPATVYNLESGRIDNPHKRTVDSLSRALREKPPSDVEKATKQAAEVPGLGSLEDFDPHNTMELPEVAGVYVFYDISQRPVYVGEGQDISDRIKAHRDKFWFKAPIVQTASFIRIHDKTLRTQVEEILIKFLKSNAVLNRQLVERG